MRQHAFHSFADNSLLDDKSPISSFYADRSVLVTGATGFLGQILVYKLLSACPRIKRVYVVIRGTKGKRADERGRKLLANSTFEDFSCKALSKVAIVEGDVTRPQLGLSDDVRDDICREVSVVFHSAATVKFNETLRNAVNVNICGTDHVLELCSRMAKVEAFIYLSTCYSNCMHECVEERVYPMDVTPDQIIRLTESVDDRLLEKVTPLLLETRPNTYTFTKALAELLISEHTSSVPKSIVRCSVVGPAWREPSPGSTGGILQGLFTLGTLYGLGVLRAACFTPDKRMDVVPVDMVSNACIAAAWMSALRPRPEKTGVYNMAANRADPFNFKEYFEYWRILMSREPSIQTLLPITSSDALIDKGGRFAYKLRVLLFHVLYARLFDAVASCFGKTLGLARKVATMNLAIDCMAYFTTRQWIFECGNLHNLLDAMTAADRETFCFDVRRVNYKQLYESGWRTIRKDILHDDTPVEVARIRLTLLTAIYKTLSTVVSGFMLYGLYWVVQFAFQAFDFALKLSTRLDSSAVGILQPYGQRCCVRKSSTLVFEIED